MAVIDIDGGIDSPEIVIGIVAAVGAPISQFCDKLLKLLQDKQYKTQFYHLSELLEASGLECDPVSGSAEFQRINTLMTKGDMLCEATGRNDTMALYGAARINASRSGDPPPLLNRASVLRQLKRPEEVYTLRKIYGECFHLVGLYCPEDDRERNLMSREMTQDEAARLIERDKHEAAQWGQRFQNTFHLADVFVEMRDPMDCSVVPELKRFLDLLFGCEIITPTRDEYGMYFADAAALRSSQLSRQVGAAILSKTSEIIAVGCNEVPTFSGGQYWGDEGNGDEERDGRDHHRKGGDTSDAMKLTMVEEVLANLQQDWSTIDDAERASRVADAVERLKNTQLMSLTEFGRAVHAEMEALTSAARLGVSLRASTLYTTTFPCHGCAKHIIGAGIIRVVYIEPYPKSLATVLHDDSMSIEDTTDESKVSFVPFVGVAPRRYDGLFSMETREGRRVRRKDASGKPIADALGLRLYATRYSFLELEGAAADTLGEIIPKGAESDSASSEVGVNRGAEASLEGS